MTTTLAARTARSGSTLQRPAHRLALTMGDPAGIGPEIIAKATRDMRAQVDAGLLQFQVCGSAAAMAQAERALGLMDQAPYEMIDVGPVHDEVKLGAICAAGGEWAYRAVAAAAERVLRGQADAIVTAPLSKEALHLAGHAFEGHTELLAHLTGQRDAVMMLAHDSMRVTHVTTHCALTEVPKRITPVRLRRVIDTTIAALNDLGFANPRIGVAGLNPHAGEGGILGQEDEAIIAPVIREYAARGVQISGPVPGDTVFIKLRAGQYDAVVAMFHDQGHIPVKLLGFQVDPATGQWQAISGVNITLGLPILRTSVDHGTAFDIAGRGIANANSMVEAADYALKLLEGRRAAVAA